MSWNIQSQMGMPADQEADSILQQEKDELEALVALMQEDENRRNQSTGQGPNDDRSSAFCSDDEEYDNIFMNLIDENGGAGVDPEQQQNHPQSMGDEMDLS